MKASSVVAVAVMGLKAVGAPCPPYLATIARTVEELRLRRPALHFVTLQLEQGHGVASARSQSCGRAPSSNPADAQPQGR